MSRWPSTLVLGGLFFLFCRYVLNITISRTCVCFLYFVRLNTGNTLNCNHPVVKELVLDSLRHWYGRAYIYDFSVIPVYISHAYLITYLLIVVLGGLLLWFLHIYLCTPTIKCIQIFIWSLNSQIYMIKPRCCISYTLMSMKLPLGYSACSC
jgi:hypothetical protein